MKESRLSHPDPGQEDSLIPLLKEEEQRLRNLVANAQQEKARLLSDAQSNAEKRLSEAQQNLPEEFALKLTNEIEALEDESRGQNMQLEQQRLALEERARIKHEEAVEFVLSRILLRAPTPEIADGGATE